MSMPSGGVPRQGSAKGSVDDTTAEELSALAQGRTSALEEASELRELLRRESGLDQRSFALVKIAALVAMDAPPASFLMQVGEALDAGIPARDILGVLTAIAPQVGLPRVVAAAPEIMVALDLELPVGTEI